MHLIGKIVIRYFAAVGIATHLLALAIWVTKPQLVWRAEEIAGGWMERHGLAPNPAVAASDPVNDLRQALPPWKPDPTAGPATREIRVAGASFTDPAAAARHLGDRETLEIGPGVYRTGLRINASDVTIRGYGHVIFDGAEIEGKGALVIKGQNTRIVNIECRNIKVRDGNGACVRLEGRDLTLDHVYFHNSQEGLLTGSKPGLVTITNSRFELLGNRGKAHGLYIGGGQLIIRNSQILSSVREGHEIKSRAETTLIEHSIIASLGGNDSRLIDISNGGRLVIRDSVLEEGPASVNSDVIGFALESPRHSPNQIELTKNIILLDKNRHGLLLHLGQDSPQPKLYGNVIVGVPKSEYPGVNIWLSDRKEAGLGPYPALPPVPHH